MPIDHNINHWPSAGFCFVLVGVILLTGCCPIWTRTVPVRVFKAVESQQPLTMFDKYLLDPKSASDSAVSHCLFQCFVSFVEDVPANVPHDSIPIFVVDSFCFEGACLDSSFCIVPIGYAEYDRRLVEVGRLRPPRKSQLHNLDLAWDKDRIWPSGFIIWDGIELPVDCASLDVTVVIHARLLDRPSGREIAREARRVPLARKRWRRCVY